MLPQIKILEQFMLQVLELINYQNDKKEFSNKFLDLCNRKTFLLIAQSMTPEEEKIVSVKAAQPGFNDQQLISSLNPKKYVQLFEIAFKETFGSFVKKITPTLSLEQRKQLLAFLEKTQSSHKK